MQKILAKQNKTSLMNAKDQLEFKVERFSEIKKKCQIVSNNMTNNQ